MRLQIPFAFCLVALSACGSMDYAGFVPRSPEKELQLLDAKSSSGHSYYDANISLNLASQSASDEHSTDKNSIKEYAITQISRKNAACDHFYYNLDKRYRTWNALSSVVIAGFTVANGTVTTDGTKRRMSSYLLGLGTIKAIPKTELFRNQETYFMYRANIKGLKGEADAIYADIDKGNITTTDAVDAATEAYFSKCSEVYATVQLAILTDGSSSSVSSSSASSSSNASSSASASSSSSSSSSSSASP